MEGEGTWEHTTVPLHLLIIHPLVLSIRMGTVIKSLEFGRCIGKVYQNSGYFTSLLMKRSM